VEGKKNRALSGDCQGVSEMMGQVLMIAIVVLAFSSIAITVFSDKGIANSPHTPRADFQEKIDRNNNILYIFHQGGEAIDLKDVKIILSKGEKQEGFDLSSNRSEFNYSATNDVLMLGDYIEINPTYRGINLTTGNPTMYFVHTPSQQVIQRVTL
jgi:FlaG/FlaF family flagellin (archaellin)